MTFARTLSILTLAAATLASAPADARRRLGGSGQRDLLERIASADADHDGVVTRDEYRTSRLDRFNHMDRNGDGVISRADFGRLIKFRPEIGERIDALLAEADANHDGRVTREELDKAPMPLFDRVDTNHDGKIDQAELAAARDAAQQLREKAGG